MENMVETTNQVRFVVKRSGVKEPFELEKIQNAIIKALGDESSVEQEIIEKVARASERELFKYSHTTEINVDEIGDVVENKLMDVGLNNVAKEYILHRSKSKADIFKKRVNLKPYEYPELVQYVDAIRHSYWVHTECNFTSDVQDFMVHLDEKEKTAVQRAMLAISQIEIAVKPIELVC